MKWVFLAFAFLGLFGCNRDKPCVQRTSDGPWVRVGKEIPSEEEIARQFAAGKDSALLDLLGKPYRQTSDELMWVFETRSETRQVWCDPHKEQVKYDQVFTVIRVRRDGDEQICEVEGVEFIEPEVLKVEDALRRPRTPLGFGPRPCKNS